MAESSRLPVRGEDSDISVDSEDTNFEHLKCLNGSRAIDTIRPNALHQTGKNRKRHRMNKVQDVELAARTESQMVPSTTQQSESDLTWWFKLDPVIPFVKFPIDIGPSERELVSVSKLKNLNSSTAFD
jgi:hypothetical protein